MAEYSINFSTNASQIEKDLISLQGKLAQTTKLTQRTLTINFDASALSNAINTTFAKINKEIERNQRKLSRLQIGGGNFQEITRRLGRAEGLRERGQAIAEPTRLRAQAEAFEPGSLVATQKILQAIRIEASQVRPNTPEWVQFQKQIGEVALQMQRVDQAAESIQLTAQMGAFAPGSLARLETQLTVLRNRAREISPSTTEWKQLNKEIQNVETSIEKINRRPLTMGQRAGAAGGAFLYGGGLGGGIGSAVGGIAGGLAGGVPGAFTGAAIGQAVDNLSMMTAAMVEQAVTVNKLRLGLAAASTGLYDFAEGVRAVESISDRLLIPVEQVTRKFTQLRATTSALGMDTETTAKIFEGTTAAVLRSGGSLDDVDGAMRAVVQVFSKGKLTAEELRGQLAERLPGAVVDFAKSAGMSVEELDAAFDSGSTTLDQFVKFLREKASDAESYVDEMGARSEYAGERMSRAFEKLRINVGNALQPTGAAIQDFATNAINWLDGVIRKAIDLKIIKPGAGFYTEQALKGEAGGIAGIEQRALEADLLVAKMQELKASMGPLGFLAIPGLNDAKNNAEALGQALVNAKNYGKNVAAEMARIRKESIAAQAPQQLLNAIEQREDAILNARKQREEALANIRKQAIEQAKQLEEDLARQRIDRERDIAATRREIANVQRNIGFSIAEQQAAITGGDPELVSLEREITNAANERNEEKVRVEQQLLDEQADRAKAIENFKLSTAEAINEANARYAKAIGDAQQQYARAVAKIVEEGTGRAGKKLEQAAAVAAALIRQAGAVEAFRSGTGVTVTPKGSKAYELQGRTYTAGEFLETARMGGRSPQESDALYGAALGVVQSTVALEKAQKALGGLEAAASTANIPIRQVSVDTSDLTGRLGRQARVLDSLSESFAALRENLRGMNFTQTVIDQTIDRMGDLTDMSRNYLTEINKIRRVLDLRGQGFGEAEAEQMYEIEQATKAAAASMAEAERLVPGLVYTEEWKKIRQNFEIAKKNVLGYAQAIRDMPAGKLAADLRDQLAILRAVNNEEARRIELQKQGYSTEKIEEIIDLERVKQNLEEARRIIDDFVTGTTNEYKDFIKAVINGESAKDALQKFQEGLKDRVLTIFLDFAMAPVEQFFQEQLKGIMNSLMPKTAVEDTPQTRNTTALEQNTQAINANTAAITGQGTSQAGATSSATGITGAMQEVNGAVAQAAKETQVNANTFGESLGKATSAIGIAAGSIMGIAAGVSQIKEGSTSGVLGGIGSILLSVGGAMGGFTKLFAANGGIATGGWKPMPVRPFANGGMVTGPTLGLIGEGKYNEAIVPLPDGRSIPVQLQGDDIRDKMGSSMGNRAATPMLSMSFQSTVINGVEYVDRAQLEAAMAETRRMAAREGASRGANLAIDRLANSPSSRRRIGIR